MDHKFLWCATAVVARLTFAGDYGESYSHNVSAIKTAIHENIYEYDVRIDSTNYHFKYSFDSNTFARGKLEIKMNDVLFKTLGIIRDLNGLKVYTSEVEYIQFYSFNNKQLIGIKIVDNKKEAVASINIETKSNDEEHEDYTIYVVTAVPSALDKANIPLHVLLFAVNGVSNKDFYYCHDVNVFASQNISMVIFSEVSGQIICVDTKLKRIHNEQIGIITVMNSDFNQSYDYVYDVANNIYFVEESVRNRKNQTVIKDKFSYREKRDVAYINEKSEYTVTTVDTNDVVFRKV